MTIHISYVCMCVCVYIYIYICVYIYIYIYIVYIYIYMYMYHCSYLYSWYFKHQRAPGLAGEAARGVGVHLGRERERGQMERSISDASLPQAAARAAVLARRHRGRSFVYCILLFVVVGVLDYLLYSFRFSICGCMLFYALCILFVVYRGRSSLCVSVCLVYVLIIGAFVFCFITAGLGGARIHT